VKERLTTCLAGAASGLATKLAGAPWWAVLLAVLVVVASTYGVVCWLATHSEAKRISTFLITWEALAEPEKALSDGDAGGGSPLLPP
jgi:cell division protein FtsW (lipid II flippase)